MEQQGKVVRFVSEGNLSLTQAIESGMLTADAQRLCERVAAENKELTNALAKVKRENAKLRNALTVERKLNRQHVQARIAGYKAVLDDNSDMRRMRDLRWTLYTAVFSAGALTAMWICIALACRIQ